ncbi:MAG TPA: penicillin-binding transpeptidase domain-containing protein, partial [Patescibacteria group bacterium]|nr:penicillin-binding transpeptidase domain-containing protein [Patescibacteria group bacterium]
MYTRNYRRRFDAVFVLFIVFLLLCIARLLYVQFFRSAYLAEIARKQHSLFVELEPRRGTIYDANLKPQAINISVDSLFADPHEIPDKNKEELSRQLASILNVDYAYVRDRLSRKKSFIWLARKLTPEQSQAVRALKGKGLDFMKEGKRSYPNGYLASHIIGFAGLDNKGLAGIEMSCDHYLKGEAGWMFALRDARQKKLDLSEKMVSPKDGYDVILTMDEVIQYVAERELDKAVKQFHAKGGSIVVLNPHTGAILALANRPTFDLNEYNLVDKDAWRNRAVCDLFEPGSVFKIVTASGALEENKVKESDRFFCENGSYSFAGHVLHDHRSHGTLTFQEVIEQSSNIGTSKVAQLLGPDLLYRYIKLFG